MKWVVWWCLVFFLVVNCENPSIEKYLEWREEFHANLLTRITSEEELEKRVEIFAGNLNFIESHNQNPSNTYTVKVNQFADLTTVEFNQQYLSGLKPPARHGVRPTVVINPSSLPTHFDWRNFNVVSTVQNQQNCNACWAFAATGAIEALHALRFNLTTLSAQNLVDCSFKEGNEGCQGGSVDRSFEYVLKNHGIASEEAYPYTSSMSNCKYSKEERAAWISTYSDVLAGSEDQLAGALVNEGPVAVCIDASDPGFQFYSSGIFYTPFCSQVRLNHALLLVGYGSTAPVYYSNIYDNFTVSDYWIAKNSWGKFWGRSGYVWIARNMNNTCGIASRASYPS